MQYFSVSFFILVIILGAVGYSFAEQFCHSYPRKKNVQIRVKPPQIMIIRYTSNIFLNNLQDLKVPKGGGGSRRGSLNPEAVGDGGEGETEVSIDII